MLPDRPSPASSTEWFSNLDVLNEYLTAQTCEGSENYDMSRVRVAVIDSGLREERQGDAYITYQNFIETWNDAHKDNPQHGTNSVDLVRKVYGRADIYVAKVFQGDEADGNTSKYMAEVRNYRHHRPLAAAFSFPFTFRTTLTVTGNPVGHQQKGRHHQYLSRVQGGMPRGTRGPDQDGHRRR